MAVQAAVADVTGATATPTLPAEATEEDASGSTVFADGTEQPIVDTSRNNPGGGATTPRPRGRPCRPRWMKSCSNSTSWNEHGSRGDHRRQSKIPQRYRWQTNDTYEWTAQNEAKIVTGNAIGVFVTINDGQPGRLGGRGERHEETWRTTQ